ncbi:hypothetical protein DYB36_013598 [Aphanomyces astaci]|uniref:Anoctamin transmembrane domain-containing protein n=1 Tax=Aphanomyces astaci TaxID=112090 RepID=A0A397ASX2_APHAT|nr:hypothetical protein DYB36_013598 [Aphanomyces astaci]
MIRFGYVTMFLTVFPGAPFFVVLTNTLEMHLDVQCSLEAHRRPAAVTVNCALLYLTTDIHAYLPTSFFAADAATSTAKLWVLLGVEHLVLGIKAAMALGIPDSPPWVDAYYAKLAKTHLISPPPTRSAEATAVGAASNNEDKQGSFEVETMECMEQPTSLRAAQVHKTMAVAGFVMVALRVLSSVSSAKPPCVKLAISHNMQQDSTLGTFAWKWVV